MINLVELTITHEDEYLLKHLGVQEFPFEEFIISWTTIGIRSNRYNNNFTSFIDTRVVEDDDNKYDFTELLPMEDYEDLLLYIRKSKKAPIFRCILAFKQSLEYLGIVDWYNVYTETLPMIDISKFIKSLPE